MENLNSKEIISDYNISILRQVLGTPEKYLHHMEVLATARNMVYKKIEEDGLSTEHSLFSLFETLNEIYGAIFDFRVKKRCEEVVNNRITIEI